VTYGTYQEATFQENALEEVDDVLAESQYEQLEMLSFSVQYTGTTPFRNPEHVTVTVGRPGGGDYPNLAPTIRDRIMEATGERVGVQIRYVEVDAAT
jgi:hypothetical protein